MLRGIDPLLSPELLQAMAAMGHGDELAIVDANFPAASCARRLLRIDGADAPAVLAAVLSLLPLDSFVPEPVAVMAVVGDPAAEPPAVRDFRAVLARLAGKPVAVKVLPREEFYERARRAFAIVATGERRFYGNILLAKGVIGPDEGG
ncbi:MAG TPA: RbsD/FucU domain-containing protein [Stellaceae bacterium]|nr:RbsD/FucU domain-containing protein [Stellaceae bacterium]